MDYTDFCSFEQVVAKARTACFYSGQWLDDHFVDVTDMIVTEGMTTAISILETAVVSSKSNVQNMHIANLNQLYEAWI